MCTALSKTVKEVRRMYLSEVVLLDQHWAKFPPSHISLGALVAGLLGRKRRPAAVVESANGAKARAMQDSISRQMRGEVN